jgi:hypothetical protein
MRANLTESGKRGIAASLRKRVTTVTDARFAVRRNVPVV